MSFPRYEQYKESGVEWLGDVPEHWSILPLLAVGRERDERNTGMAESNLLSLSYGRIIRKDINTNEGLLPESFETYQIVHPGDIIFRLTDLQNDKRSLRTAIVAERGIITSAYLALKPLSGNPYFLNYLFRAYDLRKVFYAMGSGVRQSMNYEDVKRMEILLPPMEEQVAIARFLDRETTKIDALIQEQRRLIVLLKEKREAVISRAVTKGLNPSTPVKDSGVDWLGDVPAHWECGPLKRFARVIDCKHHTVAFLDEGLPVVSIRELEGDRIDLTDAKLTSEDEWRFLREDRIPQIGDLIFCRNASVGAVGEVLAGMEFCMGQDVCLVRPNAPSGFYYYVLSSTTSRSQIDAVLVGATIRRLNVEAIRNLEMAQPPPIERLAIADCLREATQAADELITQASSAIALLQERRSALISAAVTGKINVTSQVAKPVRSTWSAGFARQVLAAETLSRCNGPRMGRIKLQKLIHLCEYHAQLDEVRGTYSRQAAGPFAPQVMEDVREGLLQQRWFEEYKDESRYAYRALEKANGHKQYLPHWEDKQARIDQVLNLLGGELTQKCEIASTLYAAWNDLLIEGKNPTDAEIIHEASSAERWHESKEKIAAEKWPDALKWMRANCLVPVGYGTHTTHQPDLFTREGHEPA